MVKSVCIFVFNYNFIYNLTQKLPAPLYQLPWLTESWQILLLITSTRLRVVYFPKHFLLMILVWHIEKQKIPLVPDNWFHCICIEGEEANGRQSLLSSHSTMSLLGISIGMFSDIQNKMHLELLIFLPIHSKYYFQWFPKAIPTIFAQTDGAYQLSRKKSQWVTYVKQ